ncbi:MAG: hypothetical protein RIR26_476, partial [Pseudomonadota bacterium]
IDRCATVVITVVGLSVILAVAGMMLFLISSSWPLFEKEKFTPAGHISRAESPAQIMFDENAPLAVLLPQNLSAGCFVRATLVESDDTNDSSKPPTDFKYQLVKTPAAEGSPEAAWNLAPQYENAGHTAASASVGTDSAPSCISKSPSTLLVRAGDSLLLVNVSIVREFLSSEYTRLLTTEQRGRLEQKKWLLLEDATLLVKASAQSPVAKIILQSRTEWEIPEYFKNHPQNALENLRFIPRPGKKDGLIVNRSAGQNTFQLLTSVENTITGESKIDLRDITAQQKSFSPVSPDIMSPCWIEGRFIVLATTDGNFLSFDTEDAQLSSAVLTLPPALGTVRSIAPSFGGAAALAEFDEMTAEGTRSEPRKHWCASLDVGRATRTALNASDALAEIPILWQDACSTAVKTLQHPHKRVAFRIGENAPNSDTIAIEARELTTGRTAATLRLPSQALSSLNLDPQGHFLTWLNADKKRYELVEFIAPHVEVSMRSLFDKIRYESYEDASYSWQSTSGNDEFQSKFSLMPLVWGTFKATLYSLLFAVPLAIFAAIYSSEILDRQTRNVVKPALEMMASIPSVVLGFLAAIIIAPWVETHIVSVLLIGTTMPFLLYVFGIFLQIPSARHLTTRGLYASRRLLLWVILGFSLMLWSLTRAGFWIEKTAFGGNLQAFLSGGTGTEGVLWGLLLLPLVFIGLWSLPVRRARNWYRIAVFVLGPIISVGFGSILAGHTELRSDFLGQYAQRNTLVIAIAMGFAIIPIIYSLAEDALTSVPNSLRAGSLACGASVWQTTARVVLPTAASGLFSAIMVGLGRGIGETMIAVMATGNTAVMTTNPFDGLRSMAANIAVELPEAAQGSSHYRILFLSALLLFMFTFTLNSLAEFLRARYRDRNKAL